MLSRKLGSLCCCAGVLMQPKGAKAEMAVELLRAFGLDTATAVPVQLLRAVKLERFKRLAWDGPNS